MAIINLFSNTKFWRVGVISLLLSAISIPAMMAQSEDNSDSVPYRLLIPLLQPFPLPGEATQLQVGAELPALPVDLPIPQSGALQWSLINRPQHFTLLFEVAQPRSQAKASYLEQLQASGWRPWLREEFSPPVSSESYSVGSIRVTAVYGSYDGLDKPQSEPLILCKQGSNAQLLLHLFQANSDSTKLQIQLIAGQAHSVCDPQEPTVPELFPDLVLPPPPDAQIDVINSGGSSDYSERQVKIQTPLPLEVLADHYAAQMRQQGWDMQSSSGNDLLQASVWSRTDSPESFQQAAIHLFTTEQSNQYIGAFRAQKNPWQLSSLFFSAFNIRTGELPKAKAVQVLRDRGLLLASEPYQLWLEQLPPALSDQLPIPSETTILGGASTAHTGTAILETSLHPQTVRTFYRESLTTAGWQAPKIWLPFHGFAFAGFHNLLPQVFCQPEEETEIMLQALPRPNDLTTIRLSLYPSGELSPCRVDREAYSIPNRDFWANIPFPNLQAPPETTVVLGDGGSGGNHISSTVYLQTRLTAEALANHYAEQMRQAGWTRRTATQSEGSSVSLWRIETDAGNVWEGLLSFIAQLEPGYWAGSFTAISDGQTEQWIPVQ